MWTVCMVCVCGEVRVKVEWTRERKRNSCLSYLYWEKNYESCLMNVLSRFSFLHNCLAATLQSTSAAVNTRPCSLAWQKVKGHGKHSLWKRNYTRMERWCFFSFVFNFSWKFQIMVHSPLIQIIMIDLLNFCPLELSSLSICYAGLNAW